MKLCENYIFEADHCVDIITQCRSMSFQTDRGMLPGKYSDYTYFSVYEYIEANDYGGNFSKSERNTVPCWIVIIIICLLSGI